MGKSSKLNRIIKGTKLIGATLSLAAMIAGTVYLLTVPTEEITINQKVQPSPCRPVSKVTTHYYFRGKKDGKWNSLWISRFNDPYTFRYEDINQFINGEEAQAYYDNLKRKLEDKKGSRGVYSLDE